MDELTADDAPLLAMLMELIQVGTWDDARAIVDRSPALLTDRALVLLDLVGAQLGTPEARGDDAVQMFGRFLRRCREIGVEAAYAEMAGDVQLPDWLAPFADLIMSTADVDVELRAYHDVLTDRRFGELVPALRAQLLARAGHAMLRRAELDPRDDEIEQALRQLELATMLAGDETPVGKEILDYLFYGHVLRYERGNGSEDLEATLDVLSRQDRREGGAVRDRAHYLATLGHALLDRYDRKDRPAALKAALRVLEQAVETSAEDDPELAERLDELGAAHLQQFELAGANDQLERAIACLSRAVRGTPGSSPDRPGRLTNLGNALLTRYERYGDRTDLDDAIVRFEQSIAAAPAGDRSLATLLSNYSNGLWRRYEHDGRLPDLDAAVAVLQQASVQEATPWQQASIKNNLGFNLRRRYERRGRLDDLNAAIATSREAVELFADRGPLAQSAVNNLGIAIMRRYEHTGIIDDLQECTALLRRAVELSSPDAPELPTYLANLGGALRLAIEAYDDRSHLDEMVLVFERAVDLTAEGSPELARRLVGLGYGLLLRNRPADIARGTEIIGRAVAGTPADSPDLPRRLSIYGQGLLGQPAAGDRATPILRRACESGLEIDLQTTLATALLWGDWAQDRRSWPEAAEAYGFGLAAMRSLVRVQLVRTEKESWLQQSSDLGAAAAFAYTAVGARTEAVVALEQTRAALLDEALQRDRANLEHLRGGSRHELVERYQQAATRITAVPLA